MWPFWLRLINIAVLLGALPSIWPYGYYTLLRICTVAVFGILAYSAQKARKQVWLATFIFIVLLYNPIIPIHLKKEIWLFINLATIGLLGISFVSFKSKEVMNSFENDETNK